MSRIAGERGERWLLAAAGFCAAAAVYAWTWPSDVPQVTEEHGPPHLVEFINAWKDCRATASE